MEPQYHSKKVEQAAQTYWDSHHSFKTRDNASGEKYYCLCMFPYPSGKCHIGHVRNYTIGDVISRFQRMNGKNVLQPMGWDAFGMPAENAAIERNVPPAQWTYQNIEQMKEQLKQLGFAYDWDKEIATCRPEYYRWEQWFFLKLYEKGLVYKKNAMVNWDPVDQTVLANEQVIDGKGWRSNAPVERREIPQWFLKITDYADELLESLDSLTEWPERVKTMQKNWIGRSKGASVHFPMDQADPIEVFTTRPDTLLGATFIALAPQHPIVKEAAQTNPELQAFVEQCAKGKTSEADLATAEKLGFDLKLTATHPLTGQPIPIWVANYVLIEYGSGAIMAVPGHDSRDWEFAKKYKLPIQQVIQPLDGSSVDIEETVFTEKGTIINSGEYNGLNYEDAFQAIVKDRVLNNFNIYVTAGDTV